VTDPPTEPSPPEDETAPGQPTGPARVEHGSEEEIDEASDESFPASDAPQWWSGDTDTPD
jgi:hypothetical protein